MAKTNWSFTQESLDCFDESLPVHLDPGAQPLKLQHVLQLQLPSDDVTPISNSLCSF